MNLTRFISSRKLPLNQYEIANVVRTLLRAKQDCIACPAIHAATTCGVSVSSVNRIMAKYRKNLKTLDVESEIQAGMVHDALPVPGRPGSWTNNHSKAKTYVCLSSNNSFAQNTRKASVCR